MDISPQYIAATPVLASLDIERSADFFSEKLGFEKVYVAQGLYGIVRQGPVEVHFWACGDRKIAEATSCRIRVKGVRALYATCSDQGIVHPNAPLGDTAWGTTEFAVLDLDGNLITFYESSEA